METKIKSGGQSLPAFLTAAFDDQTSGVGGHAGKETDPAFAAPIGRLISSFHLRFSLFLLIYIVYRFAIQQGGICLFTAYIFII